MLEVVEADELDGTDVRGGENDGRGDAGFEGFLPAHGAQAPAIAGLKAGKSRLRHGRAEVVAELRMPPGSVATSGNSERGFVIDGERHGHILDPRTGRPAHDFGSLSIWARTAALADCLATGLYVLGPDAALAFAASRPDVEALVVEVTEAGLVARTSSGFDGALRALSPRLSIVSGGPAAAAR